MKTVIALLISLALTAILTSCSNRETESEAELRELEQDRIELAKEAAETRKEYEKLKKEYQREKEAFQREQKNLKSRKVVKELKTDTVETIK